MLVDLKHLDLRFSYNNVWISSSIFKFSFRISERSANWKSSGKNSDWTNDKLIVICWILLYRLCIFREYLWRSCLVYLPACLNNSTVLIHIRWFMIPAQSNDVFASIWWKHNSTITNIGSITDISYYQDTNSAWSWPINNSPLACLFILLLTNF